MPYDFTLVRTDQTDNEIALGLNRKVAQHLLDSFSELYDPHQRNSPYHFTNRAINNSDEYPELHFHLEAEFEDYCFRFDFWKDYINIELGAGHQPNALFNQVRKYAQAILPFGFKIEAPENDAFLELESGIAQNQQAYSQWCGLVDRVADYLNKGETNA